MRRSLIIPLLLFCSLVLNAQEQNIWHVEPPNWWVGMQNTELQIMLHGSNISDFEPLIDYRGVEITKVERTSNPNYLFIYLTINENANAGKMSITLTSEDRDPLVVVYDLKSRENNSKNRKGFDASDVICLITPDRFANGDPSNDEFPDMADKLDRDNPDGRHGGDLKGIIDHLDYLADMGYTALWLNPVVENDMQAYSYHGYSGTDLYKIDPRFGSNNDYLLLSEEAHKRGIKLIMDQIMNHCGSGHWWMSDMPSEDWINSMDKYRQTTHKRVVLNDPYVAESDIKKFTEGWFVRTMPDMNQNNPLLADYLIQNSIWWVEFAKLSGIRHDTHSYAGKEFMKEYSCRIMTEYPNFNIVGEEWTLNPAIIAKWQKGKINSDNYSSCMPSMFDFPLQSALVQALTEEESWDRGWIKVYEMLSNDFLYADPFNLVIFPDNHDMDRFYTQLNEDMNLFKMGIAYNLTMRGIPQLYYGTELVMTNSNPGHGLIRSDFPGGWPGDVKNGFTSKNLSEEEIEAQLYLKKLLNWRKKSATIHNGNLMHYAPVGGVYIYFRYLDNQVVMLAFNKGMEPVDFIAENYPEMLKDVDHGYNVISEKNQSISDLILAPQSVLILEFNKNK